MSRTYSHSSSARVIIFTHDSPNNGGSLRLDVTKDVFEVTVQKTIRGAGTWQITLAPGSSKFATDKNSGNLQHGEDLASLNYFRFIQPDDFVHIYLSNGTSYSKDNPSGGFHKRMVGYVDMVRRNRQKDSEGKRRTVIVISGTDITKAWSSSTIYFNPYIKFDKLFGASPAGVRLKMMGIPITGSPSEFATFFIALTVLLGSQFELPEAYVRNLLPETVETWKETLAGQVKHRILISRLTGTSSDKFSPRLLGIESTLSTILRPVKKALEIASRLTEWKDAELKTISNILKKGMDSLVYAYLQGVIPGLESKLNIAHIIDLSYIEELFIRGYLISEVPSYSTGSIYSILQHFSNPILNELFFDLRLTDRYRYEPYAGYKDDLGFSDGPVYQPACVFREYPFSTGKVHPTVKDAGFYSDGFLSLENLNFNVTKRRIDGEINKLLGKTVNKGKPPTYADENVEEDLNYMLKTMYVEGNGQDETFLRAVAWVIRNRRDFIAAKGSSEWDGLSIREIVTSDSWNRGPSIESCNITVADEGWANNPIEGGFTPLEIAEDVYSADRFNSDNTENDITQGALYFATPRALYTSMKFDASLIEDDDIYSYSDYVKAGVEEIILARLANIKDENKTEEEKILASKLLHHELTEKEHVALIKGELKELVKKWQDDITEFRTYNGGTKIADIDKFNYSIWVPLKDTPLHAAPAYPDFSRDSKGRLDKEKAFKIKAKNIEIYSRGFIIANSPVSKIYNTKDIYGYTFEMNPINGVEEPLLVTTHIKDKEDRYMAFKFIPKDTAKVDATLNPIVASLEEEFRDTVSDVEVMNQLPVVRPGLYSNLGNNVFFKNRNDQSIDTPTASAFDIKASKEIVNYRLNSSTNRLNAIANIPGASRRYVDHITVHPDEVFEDDLVRADSEHVNLLAVHTKLVHSKFQTPMIFQEFFPIMTDVGWKRHGLRIREDETEWFEAAAIQQNFRSLPETFMEVGMLVDMLNQHNLTYISGSMKMRGRPDIRVGYRLDYDTYSSDNSNGEDYSFYVEAVVDNFIRQPLTGQTQYTTTVQLSHGQPTSEEERLPYIPPNWYFAAMLNLKRAYLYRDSAISQAPYRTDIKLFNKVVNDPERLWKSYVDAEKQQ